MFYCTRAYFNPGIGNVVWHLKYIFFKLMFHSISHYQWLEKIKHNVTNASTVWRCVTDASFHGEYWIRFKSKKVSHTVSSNLAANIWLLGMWNCGSKRWEFFLKIIQIRLQWTDHRCSIRRCPVDGDAWALILPSNNWKPQYLKNKCCYFYCFCFFMRFVRLSEWLVIVFSACLRGWQIAASHMCTRKAGDCRTYGNKSQCPIISTISVRVHFNRHTFACVWVNTHNFLASGWKLYCICVC